MSVVESTVQVRVDKLTAMDLLVVCDTMRSTLSLLDGGEIFGYAKETRAQVLHRLHTILARIPVESEPVETAAAS